MMNYKIEEIEGIGPAFGKKLAAAGVKTTGALLKRGGTPAGRKELESTTGISHAHILKWCNLADLMRVSGIGKQYSELLEAAGVDTIKELKNRSAANLAAKMMEVNDAKKLCRSAPSEKLVAKWVEQAKKTAPAISY
jgi:predicted flap endonuclease-1-like 5' DNA nuclease